VLEYSSLGASAKARFAYVMAQDSAGCAYSPLA
jgi:hypothetical protein